MAHLSRKDELIIQAFCHNLVGRNFAKMHNPLYTPESFDWERFVEMSECDCEVDIIMACANKKKQTAYEIYAKKLGKSISIRLIELAGYNI
jgi:hypothetical protein